MGRLEDKVAIVTGGAGNIGAATASRLAREGASVVVADLDESGAERCAATIREEGGRAVGQKVDLGDEDSIADLIAGAVRAFGGLDVLHNNGAATVLARTDDLGVLDTSLEVWDASLRINLRGTMLACRFAIPHLQARGGGSIINMTSGSGARGDLRHTSYGVSKAGIVQLTRAVATQHGRDGIRCNSISPGFVASTDPNRAGVAQHSDELLAQSLVGRLGRPDDIAWAVLYLASQESSFVTGQCLVVDGGASAHTPYYAAAMRRREN